MRNVISVRDIEELLRTGGDASSLPADAILTPSARDLLRDLELKPTRPGTGTPAAKRPAAQPAAAPVKVTAKSPKAELEAFFGSSPVHALKEQICDIGRRLWQRAYVDGNGGNIAVRVGEDVVLCTPTLISKGFMTPADLCLVDLDGNQLLGSKKRTSEILMHLQMMKCQPKDIASVHCHPPYATAFAVAGITKHFTGPPEKK